MAAFFLSADPSLANRHCRLDGEQVIDWLKDKFGELPVMRGLSDTGEVLFELWVNQATGTWTILSHIPGGTVCMNASGTDFEQLPQAQGTAV